MCNPSSLDTLTAAGTADGADADAAGDGAADVVDGDAPA